MADIQNSTVDEEIGSSQTGTGNGAGNGAGGGADGGSLDEQTTTIATRPDLVVGTRRFRLASLVASEGYNIGWCAHAIFAFGVPGGGASRIDILATLAERGLSPGRRARVNLRVEAEGNEVLHNQTIRTWPCMVSQMVPLDSEDDTRAICRIQLVDPLGYLASREIWGAFRDVSAAELVGGAIALAAGADEGPTTEVATAWLPKIRVRGRHRDALDVIPYAIAAGETLGEWLARVLGTLGLRAELFAEDGGDTQVVYLTDALAHRGSYEMHIERDGVELSDDEQGRDGGISIRARVAFPGNPLRGALLDDPTQGTPRVLAGFGSIGHVVRAQGADTDEVTERAWHEVRRGFCEALMVRASSGHPGIEPGCTITLNETINRIGHWQVASARHLVSEGAYDNDATLLRADTAWHPPQAEPRGTVIVSAMVDHSEESLYHEPVPRDRLGRINVRFSFLPPPNMEVAYALAEADTDRDGRVTLDDYDETKKDDYTANAEEWEKKAQAYENGDYDDPYPGIASEYLSEEQLAEREERAGQRQEAIAYLYYKRLAAPPPSSEEGTQGGTTNGTGTDGEDDDNPTAESTGDESASETQDEQTGNGGTRTEEQTRAGNGETETGESTPNGNAGDGNRGADTERQRRDGGRSKKAPILRPSPGASRTPLPRPIRWRHPPLPKIAGRPASHCPWSSRWRGRCTASWPGTDKATSAGWRCTTPSPRRSWATSTGTTAPSTATWWEPPRPSSSSTTSPTHGRGSCSEESRTWTTPKRTRRPKTLRGKRAPRSRTRPMRRPRPPPRKPRNRRRRSVPSGRTPGERPGTTRSTRTTPASRAAPRAEVSSRWPASGTSTTGSRCAPWATRTRRPCPSTTSCCTSIAQADGPGCSI